MEGSPPATSSDQSCLSSRDGFGEDGGIGGPSCYNPADQYLSIRPGAMPGDLILHLAVIVSSGGAHNDDDCYGRLSACVPV
jgi:hypothetical protein